MSRLNLQQEKAIECMNNVVLVIAGAGSGKTTVLTKRVKKLISDGIEPRSILAITFTNKATKEMKERINNNEVNINTFHSFSLSIIRKNIKYLISHDKNFSIIDEDDKSKILKKLIKDLNLDLKANNVKYEISSAKSNSLDKNDIINHISIEYISIFNGYCSFLKDNNCFDFDDLLLYAYELLKIEAVRNKYHNYLNYIHVDEYQDTSIIQSKMLDLIKSDSCKLFVVGDVDQSIYEWRGATVENIMNLASKYNDSIIIKLEQNYRSTKSILDVANNLISKNKNRIDKNLWTENSKGQKVKSLRFTGESNQAEYVKSEIKYLEDFGANLNSICVLYRYNYQSKKIEEALIRSNISYKIYGGMRFYDRTEIKDCIAYLRLLVNFEDNISFMRIINVPKRKVGEITLNKIINYAVDNKISYFESSLKIGSETIKKFCNLILDYSETINNDFTWEFNKFLDTIGYENFLLKSEDKSKVEDRMLNVNEFIESIDFVLQNEETNLLEYVNELVLFTDTDDRNNDDCVVLSTVHGVKGLEFDYVYMTGMNELVFPNQNKISTDQHLEEERRVCYVAITRAKKKLVLSNISFNYRGEYLKDSRFLNEMGLEPSEEIKSDFAIF